MTSSFLSVLTRLTISSFFVVHSLALDFFTPSKSFSGYKVTRVSDGAEIDLWKDFLVKNSGGYDILILGTYAADFNAIEYAQKAR